MLFFIIHILTALVILIAFGLVISRKKTHGLGAWFLCGWVLQIIISLPAGIFQAVFSWPHISLSGGPIWQRFLIPLIGWPFNAGGLTVRLLFEVTVGPLEWLVGHRSATVFSNLGYYWFLLAVQGSILAIIFALLYKRYKQGRRKLFFVLIVLGILFLLNSFANVRWFWAGT